jgi:hypothetical protein
LAIIIPILFAPNVTAQLPFLPQGVSDDIRIRSCLFLGNSLINGHNIGGGGMFVHTGANVSIVETSFVSNRIETMSRGALVNGGGGVLHCTRTGQTQYFQPRLCSLHLQSSLFERNQLIANVLREISSSTSQYTGIHNWPSFVFFLDPLFL